MGQSGWMATTLVSTPAASVVTKHFENTNNLHLICLFEGHPINWVLRPCVRGGLRQRQSVRHRVGRPDRQPDQGHAAGLHPGVSHTRRS